MGQDSKIEWCDHTFSPWWGCAKIAKGCENCYASDTAHRWGHAVWGKDAERRFMSDAHWRQPLKWAKKARDAQAALDASALKDAELRIRRPRVFCGSMCDVFEDRADLVEQRRRLFNLIVETPELDWLLLTKRPENIGRFLPGFRGGYPNGAFPNVWLGTSIACQADADRNVPMLLEVPARVRFLSVEPLVGPVDLTRWLWQNDTDTGAPAPRAEPLVHWVIVGGESGHRARPCDVAWVRSIVSQCREALVPVFVKQMGAKPYTDQRTRLPGEDWTWTTMLRDRKGGDASEWPEDLRVREHPRSEHA